MIGHGTQFHLASSAGVLTKIGELTAIEPGGSEWETTETTHFESPDRYREFEKTLRNGGTGSFQINWNPGDPTDALISDAVDDEGARAYKIVFPTSTGTHEATGTVLVLSRTPTVPMDDKMTCEATLQFTGKRTEAAGAGA